MICKEFQGKRLGQLGFGFMRLPLLESGAIDEAQVRAMTRYAIEHGVNYFDTAYSYHEGESERVISRVLGEYPRESFFLADKFPAHQLQRGTYRVADVFEEQLAKCGVDYFDFYLLHNVNETSMPAYLDRELGIVEYLKEQKRRGRIRHLGFSNHAQTEALKKFLDIHGTDMEFCQIQLNYLDWTLQDAKGKYALLTERGIPVWVMEPLRGGKLSKLDAEDEAALRARRPDASISSWGFRFLQELPNVHMILSGMSSLEQIQDNIKTFAGSEPLDAEEHAILQVIADKLRNVVPCTACRYCCAGCPVGLDIPALINAYNDFRYHTSVTIHMRIDAMEPAKQPKACIGCGKCTRICPQNIDVPGVMRDFVARLQTHAQQLPAWARPESPRKEG